MFEGVADNFFMSAVTLQTVDRLVYAAWLQNNDALLNRYKWSRLTLCKLYQGRIYVPDCIHFR